MPSRGVILASVLLLTLVALTYWPGLSGAPLFDDGPALTGNPQLRIQGDEADEWRTATFSSGSGVTRRPVSMLTFVAQRVAAQSVEISHLKLGNLVIHLLCGALVFVFAGQVLRRVTDASSVAWLALLAAALWLLAPLQVSTVLYAVQRMAQLSTLFTLAGLVLFLHRRAVWARHAAGAGDLLATALWLLLLLFLAVFSKENGLLMLWLIAVLEVTLFRGEWAGRPSPIIRALGWLAMLAPVLLGALILLIAPDTLLGGYQGREFSLAERLLTQARLLWHYLFWLLVPAIDQMGFQHDDIAVSTHLLAPLSTLFALLGWGTVVTLAWLGRKSSPLLLFALLFYLVGHAMESSVWPLEMVYEHRNYLPSVGVFIAAAFALSRMVGYCARFLHPAIPVFAVLATCATLLFLRVHAWAEPVRMHSINVGNHPDSARSHFFMAEALLNRFSAELESANAEAARLSRYLVLARHHFERMHQLNPRDVAALVMLHYMDSYHLPELRGKHDWFGKLLALLQTRRLQASDFSALDTLIGCIEDGYCPATGAQVEALFSTLESRYPHNSNMLLLRIRYLIARDYPPEQRESLLARAEGVTPGNTRIYQQQLKLHHQTGDISALLESSRKWLLHDHQRRDLTEIRRLFRMPDQADVGAAPDA